MSKNKDIDLKQVRSINKNVRSSVRKLKPILKSIVGKKVEIAIKQLNIEACKTYENHDTPNNLKKMACNKSIKGSFIVQ